MSEMIVRPAIYKGQKLKNYGVHKKTGDLYSFCKPGKPKKRVWSHRNPKDLSKSYPCMSLADNEVFAGYSGNALTVNVHIVVHETLSELPLPRGVTPNEWKRTPKSVKKACRDLWVVNHKDHNKLNFKPSNLEWVTPKENAEAAQKFYG